MSRIILRLLASFALLASVLVAATTSVSAQSGRDFFVGPAGDDDNAGTSIDAPVRTLQQGAGLIGPGDTLWVLEGTYDGFSATATGSPSAYARIAAYPGTTPKISAGDGNGAHFHNSSYVEMWGLELEGDSDTVQTPTAVGILITGTSHHIRLVQNEVHHFGAGGLITFHSGDHLEVYHNTIHHNAHWNPDQHSGVSLLGLESDGTGDSAGYNNYVIGNLIYGNEVKVQTDQFGGGTRVTDGNCFVVDVTLESDYTGKTLFGSNICVNNGGRGTQVYRSADVDVINNTFHQNMRTPDVAAIGSEVMAYDSKRVRFANNLIVSRPGVLPLTAGITDPVTFSHNVTVGNRNPEKHSSDTHLSDGTSVMVNPSNDPASLNAANFAPVDSGAAHDHGAANFVSGLAVDFSGNQRQAGSSPDAGAVERDATAAADWPWNGTLEGPGGAAPAPAPEPTAPVGGPETPETPEPNTPTNTASEEREAALNRLYSAAFLRAPDSEGLDYWLNLDATMLEVSEYFAGSPEFVGRYGQLDNDGFVAQVYRNVFLREADSEGFDYWTGLLNGGVTRAEVLLALSDSAEFRAG